MGRRPRRDDRALPRSGRLTAVTFHAPPRVGRTIGYQKYYLLGLEETARLRVRGLPPVPGVRAKVSLAYRFGRGGGEAWVGRYERDGVRFAVDAHDRREIKDPEALAWADVYFKANRWPDDDHDPKVLPVVNGNGLLDRRKIGRLRALRAALERLLGDAALRERLGVAARERIRSRFAWDAVLDATTELYAEAAG